MNKNNSFYKYSFFARHETFCPRYGWLKKGFDRVAGDNGYKADCNIFDDDYAIEKLGVGKNMVRSIRFWCMAFKIILPQEESAILRIGGPMRPTDFGCDLLSEHGWDPYLEDPASLWLLHWKLFTEPLIATAWSLAVNLTSLGTFTLNDLTLALTDLRDSDSGYKRYSESSFKKDASCFIRMYGSAGKETGEQIESPFTELELLIPGDRPQSFRFNLDDKPTLSDRIFLAACFEYAKQYAEQSSAISLNRLAYGINSPGAVFKLSESAIGNRLERAIPKIKGVLFTESFGNRQLQFEKAPDALAITILKEYYKSIL